MHQAGVDPRINALAMMSSKLNLAKRSGPRGDSNQKGDRVDGKLEN